MVNNNTATNLATIAADFDNVSTPEAENAQWKENNASKQYPLGLSGSAALTEGWHYITTYGKASSATPTPTVSVFTGGGEEVRIPQ